jgi:hypothetical protein
MNDKQLDRSLRSIGKACFVKYFYNFRDAEMEDYDLIERLMVEENYQESGCKIRVSQARRIFRENREIDALRGISRSERVSIECLDRSKVILAECLST